MAPAPTRSGEIWLGKLETYLKDRSVDDVRRLLEAHQVAAPVASYQGAWRNLIDEQQVAQVSIVRQLEEMGVSVHTAAVDISDEKALASFLTNYDAEGWPPIRGVIHAAGIVKDSSLSQLDVEDLQAVARPKVYGAWSLHHLLHDAPLDFFACFSSAASILGSPGQANYAAANAFMDALAHYRRHRGQPAISINWAGWNRVGMANRSGVGARWERLGVAGIPARQGLAVLGNLLAQDAPQVGVLPIAPAGLGQLYPQGFSFLENLSAVESTGATTQPSAGESILAAEPTEQPALMLAYLQQQVGRVLQTDAGKVATNLNVMEMGLDSIMLARLSRERAKPRTLRHRSNPGRTRWTDFSWSRWG